LTLSDLPISVKFEQPESFDGLKPESQAGEKPESTASLKPESLQARVLALLAEHGALPKAEISARLNPRRVSGPLNSAIRNVMRRRGRAGRARGSFRAWQAGDGLGPRIKQRRAKTLRDCRAAAMIDGHGRLDEIFADKTVFATLRVAWKKVHWEWSNFPLPALAFRPAP
jgi:hypothetical protein